MPEGTFMPEENNGQKQPPVPTEQTPSQVSQEQPQASYQQKEELKDRWTSFTPSTTGNQNSETKNTPSDESVESVQKPKKSSNTLSEFILLILLSIKIIFGLAIIVFFLTGETIEIQSNIFTIANYVIIILVYSVAIVGLFRRKIWGPIIAIIISALSIIGWLYEFMVLAIYLPTMLSTAFMISAGFDGVIIIISCLALIERKQMKNIESV